MLKRRDFVAGCVAGTAQGRRLKFLCVARRLLSVARKLLSAHRGAFRKPVGLSSLERRRHLCE
jgi:hypothetical protein